MRRLSTSVLTGAVVCGLLGIASAQQIDTDVTGEAGAAATNGETATATTSESAASTQLDADGAQGAVTNQTDNASGAATPSEQANADADLNIPERDNQDSSAIEAQTETDTQSSAQAATQSSGAEDQAAASRGSGSVDTEADADVTNDSRSPQRANQTDASSLPRNSDAMAGMTFRSNTDGIVLDSVADNSAAAQVGLQPGDEIVRFNGQWVDSPQQLDRLLSNSNMSQPVDIAYRRDGRQFGRQIALDGAGQAQTAMRPDYNQSGNAYESADQPSTDSSQSGQYGNSKSGNQSFRAGAGCGQTVVTAGYHSGSWNDCCRQRVRRQRRCCCR